MATNKTIDHAKLDRIVAEGGTQQGFMYAPEAQLAALAERDGQSELAAQLYEQAFAAVDALSVPVRNARAYAPS